MENNSVATDNNKTKEIISHISSFTKKIAPFSLVFLLLGGLWQFWALARLSLSFLRFFSVTQQISDGLILFIVFVIFYFLIYFFIGWKNKLLEKLKETEVDKKDSFFKIGLYIIFIVVTFQNKEIFYSDLNIYRKFDLETLFFFIFISGTYLFVTLYIILIICALIFKIDTIPNFLRSVYISLKKIIPIFFIIILYLLLNFILKFHENYFLPQNIINSKTLLSNYRNENNVSVDSINIVYFNDKYIFLKIGDEFDILEFKEFF